MHVLADEFSRQATMERELAIPTSLMSEPKKDMMSLATAQLKFMTLFAIPLFQGVADILPAMQYCVDELQLNKRLFDKCLAEEQERASSNQSIQKAVGEDLSPKTIAFTNTPEPPTEAHPARGPTELVPGFAELQFATSTAIKQTDYDHRPARGSVRMVDGIVTTFGPANDSGCSDSNSMDDYHARGLTKQRSSETTEGSSAPYTTDWASQANSATTGKMPLSPSTQGTSIVSRDSFEHPGSLPVTSVTAPESTTTVPESSAESSMSQTELKLDRYPPDEEASVRNGYTNGAKKCLLVPEEPSCRQLKKKPSRFRINGLHALFRKHKSSSPPMQAADTAG
jgi:hypothetical protein